jgi:hypothetical protein
MELQGQTWDWQRQLGKARNTQGSAPTECWWFNSYWNSIDNDVHPIKSNTYQVGVFRIFWRAIQVKRIKPRRNNTPTIVSILLSSTPPYSIWPSLHTELRRLPGCSITFITDYSAPLFILRYYTQPCGTLLIASPLSNHIKDGHLHSYSLLWSPCKLPSVLLPDLLWPMQISLSLLFLWPELDILSVLALSSSLAFIVLSELHPLHYPFLNYFIDQSRILHLPNPMTTNLVVKILCSIQPFYCSMSSMCRLYY